MITALFVFLLTAVIGGSAYVALKMASTDTMFDAWFAAEDINIEAETADEQDFA